MNNFAPVLICTLNRHVHFKRCVESLAACTHADKTDLYIGFDFPVNETHWDGYETIKAYLPAIKGFKTVNIVVREKNFGVNDNWISMQNYVFERYDRLIISEDDNEFSPNFLDYINKGLDKFENNKNIRCICGYSFPIEVPKCYTNNYYFSKGFSGWGFGIWKEKYESMDSSIANLKKFLHNPMNVIKLNDIPYSLLSGLMEIVKSGNITGDRIFCYNNIIKGTYSVFPLISKVKNLGHDGSGVNCTTMPDNNNIFITQVIDNQKTFDYDINVELENSNIYKALKFHNHAFINNNFKRNFKLKLLVKYLLFIIKY